MRRREIVVSYSFQSNRQVFTRRMVSLKVSDGYAHFKLTNSIEDLQRLAHVHEIIGII